MSKKISRRKTKNQTCHGKKVVSEAKSEKSFYFELKKPRKSKQTKTKGVTFNDVTFTGGNCKGPFNEHRLSF